MDLKNETFKKKVEERVEICKHRVKRITIYPAMLLEIMKQTDQNVYFKVTKSDIPKDAIYRGVAFNPLTGMWEVFLSHESFPEVEQGQAYGQLDPVGFTRVILEEENEKN